MRTPRFVLACAALAGAALLAAGCAKPRAAQPDAATYAYVSNADSQEIRIYRLDTAQGRLQPLGTTAVGGMVMPLAVSPDQTRLYAAVRTQPYRVLSFAIDARDGSLHELGSAPLPGTMPYLSTDPSGRWLFAASYGDNLLSLSPIDAQGVAGAPRQVIPTGPMAHAIRVGPNGRTVFASILGADLWMRLDFDAAQGRLHLDSQPAYALPKGSGPRHFVFSRDGRYAYLIDELDGKLHALRLDADGRGAQPIQTVATLPPAQAGIKPWGADLHLSPDGRFLYASERNANLLSGYRVSPEDGRLTPIGAWPTETQPRGFAIDPSGQFLLASGQTSTQLSLYAIDQRDGALRRLARYPAGRNPNWIEFVRFGSAAAQ